MIYFSASFFIFTWLFHIYSLGDAEGANYLENLDAAQHDVLHSIVTLASLEEKAPMEEPSLFEE